MALSFDKDTIAYLERLLSRGGHDAETARGVLKAAGYVVEGSIVKYSDDEERDSSGRWTSGDRHGDEKTQQTANNAVANTFSRYADNRENNANTYYKGTRNGQELLAEAASLRSISDKLKAGKLNEFSKQERSLLGEYLKITMKSETADKTQRAHFASVAERTGVSVKGTPFGRDTSSHIYDVLGRASGAAKETEQRRQAKEDERSQRYVDGKVRLSADRYGTDKQQANANRMVANDMRMASSDKTDAYSTGASKVAAGNFGELTSQEKEALQNVIRDVHGGGQTNPDVSALAEAHYASVAERSGNRDLLFGTAYITGKNVYDTAKGLR